MALEGFLRRALGFPEANTSPASNQIEGDLSRPHDELRTLEGDYANIGAPPPTPAAIDEANQATPDKTATPERGPLAHDDLARIRDEMPAIFERAASSVAHGQLALIGWGLTLPRIQTLASEHEGLPWFFIGDIHGDFLAWHLLFERVQQEKDFRLCFLGDLVDRGPMSIECFAALLEAVAKHPNQILWLLGNHDEGVQHDPRKDKKFSSTVEPAEFVDWLNGGQWPAPAEVVQSWGRLFVDVCQRLPRAVLFRDGLLATHGGVPLQDRWESLTTLEAFHHERSLCDFTWTRATAYPSKLGWKYDPARRAASSGFEFGYKDLDGFSKRVESVFPVKRVVRGHDHVEHGYEQPDCYKNVPLLTINGFGFHYLSNSVHNYRETLAIGVHAEGQLPKVEAVAYLPAEYAAVYPAEQQVNSAKTTDVAQPPVGEPIDVASGEDGQ
jgi:hypothetical protein